MCIFITSISVYMCIFNWVMGIYLSIYIYVKLWYVYIYIKIGKFMVTSLFFPSNYDWNAGNHLHSQKNTGEWYIYIHTIFTLKFLRMSLSLFPTWVGLAQCWRHSFLAWPPVPWLTVTHQAMLGKIGMVTIFMLKKTPGVPQKSAGLERFFGPV